MTICLITGASGGIGSEIAKVLANRYDTVLIQGRKLEKLNALKAQLGENCKIIVGDLNKSNDRKAILAQATQNGPIDLLVNSAGISQFSSFPDTSEDEITAMFTSNLITPTLFIRDFINAHLNPKTDIRVVNIGSAFGYIGYPGFSNYCASKFGLRGLTESLAREYSDSHFKFSYFAPRATKTDINTNTVDELNNALGNSVDSPQHVALQFNDFIKTNKRQATVGWPEKLFVKINGVFPLLVDNAIKSKLSVIKQFLTTPNNPK